MLEAVIIGAAIIKIAAALLILNSLLPVKVDAEATKAEEEALEAERREYGF